MYGNRQSNRSQIIPNFEREPKFIKPLPSIKLMNL